MKLLVTLVSVALFSVAATAQQNNLFKKKSWEQYKLKRLLEDTLSRISPRVTPVPSRRNIPYENEKGVMRIPLKGRYIGENGRGDEIYAMQPDKMPCLVPGKSFASNMPVAGIEKADKQRLPLLEKGEKKTEE